MSRENKFDCRAMEHRAVLYACDELDAAERTAVEAHAAECAACAQVLVRERALVASLADRPVEVPSAVQLAECRGALSDALDECAPKGFWHRVLDPLRPKNWFALHPAWGAAFCVMLGLTLGVLGPRWLDSFGAGDYGSSEPVRAMLPISEQELQRVGISGINILPASDSGQPDVELRLVQERPVVLRGTLDDRQVRTVLLYVVQNRRFDSGLRLDSLEALRTRLDDTQVRAALCDVLRNDRNPGVRLKALEALRTYAQEAPVRKALLDALLGDENPGVRIEAINALKALSDSGAGAADEQLLRVFRDRMQNDSNAYIRLTSAAAVRQSGPNPDY
jgi:hypothetical protein